MHDKNLFTITEDEEYKIIDFMMIPDNSIKLLKCE